MSPSPKTPMTDDELGTALGRAVRGRVDAAPTRAPGFDVIERRARRITSRRRAMAAAAIGVALVIGGIGVAQLTGGGESTSDLDVVVPPEPQPAPTPAPEPPSPSLPNPASMVTVRNGTDVVRLDPDGSETVLYSSPAFVADARVLADGSILLERPLIGIDGAAQVVHVTPDGVEAVIGEFSVLAGGTGDGAADAYAFVGDVPDWSSGVPAPERQTGDLRRVPLGLHNTEVPPFVPDAYGIEWSASEVDVHAGRYLVESGSEAGPSFVIRDENGNDLGLNTPTDGRWPGYGGIDAPGGPTVAVNQAVLSHDGTTVWWLEEPWWTDPTGPDGGMRLRSMNVDTGEEGVAVAIPAPAVDGWPEIELDHDGTHFLISSASFRPILVTPGADPEVRTLDLDPGIYRFIPTK